MSDFDELQNEEELLNLISLTNEDGTKVNFEFLDLIEYEGHEYTVLLPYEDEDEAEDGTVIILEVIPVDEETEEYVNVEDENILTAVFEIFKEHFKDDFNFVD